MTTLSTLFTTSNHITQRVLTYREIIDRGYSRDSLRTALDRKELMPLRRGVFTPTKTFQTGDHRYRALAHHVAVAKTTHRAALSHLSAALWWDVKILHMPDKVHVSVASNRNTRRDRVAVHKNRSEVLSSAVFHEGMLVSSPLQTAIDCAKTLPLADALCVADDFLHRGLCSTEDLKTALDSHTGSGSAKCRRVASLMSALPDSPAETLARMHVHLFGIEKPTEQLRIVTSSGRLCFADFAWEKQKNYFRGGRRY